MKLEEVIRTVNPDFSNGTKSLDKHGITGFAWTVSNNDWFLSAFGPFDVTRITPHYMSNTYQRTRMTILLYMARHIVWKPRIQTDGPECAAVFAYLVLHVFGKTVFSRLMSKYAKHRVNWRAIKDCDSIQAQLVALRIRGSI